MIIGPPERHLTGTEARSAASWISFAPVIFQAARSMRDLGILSALLEERTGLTADEVGQRCELTRYGATVLLDLGASVGIVCRDADLYVPTRLARYLQEDPMTRINLDFVQDVCYAGLAAMPEAIREGRPAGLAALTSEHETIYQALASLPAQVRESWFAFDHHYSDACFASAGGLVLDSGARSIVDIGGNTGRFSRHCLTSHASVRMTLVDLPGQLDDAKRELAEFDGRVRYHEHDLLSMDNGLPDDGDAIWISQVLDCFSEPEVVHILRKAKGALAQGADLWILEPFTDRQRYAAAELALAASSLYFTVMANGNSRFYDLPTMKRLVAAAGLRVVEIHDNLGTGHTLLRVTH